MSSAATKTSKAVSTKAPKQSSGPVDAPVRPEGGADGEGEEQSATKFMVLWIGIPILVILLGVVLRGFLCNPTA